MKNTPGLLAIAAVVSAGSLLAHHALTNYETTKAVRVKGIIVQFRQINPHTFLFLDGTGPDGQARRWALEGPSILQLQRRGFDTTVFKAGSVVEVCGYLPKEPIVWQIAGTDPGAQSVSGRLINAEMLIMPNGTEQSWGDYGVHRCFAPEYSDQHPRK